MTPKVFVDTGFWIALLDRRGGNHSRTKDALPQLLAGSRLILSDFVVFETLTYLNCSLRRHDLARRFYEKTSTGALDIVDVDTPIKDRAIALLLQHADKDFSVVDCTSFAIMQSQGIDQFAGFDSHFLQMGFVPTVPVR